jgi:hypothetical protein
VAYSVNVVRISLLWVEHVAQKRRKAMKQNFGWGGGYEKEIKWKVVKMRRKDLREKVSED